MPGMFPSDPHEQTRQKALVALTRAAACVTIHELPEAIFWTALGLLRLSELATDATIAKAEAIARSMTRG